MVNVPPLLCSTPPPIDFGEDDDDSGLQSTLHLEDGDADEFSEYGLVTESHEVALSAKVPSMSELSISTSQAPDLSNGHSKSSATAKQTVEAFNYQVKAPDFNPYEQEMPPPLNDIDVPANEDDEKPEAEDTEEEANTNDNIPSLKLDSLSLYSSESLSPTRTLSPVADEQLATKAPVLSHQVTLEDVTDDSDEECSPKKPKELFIPEGADDFFAIEIVATPTPPALCKQIPNVDSKFAAFEEAPPADVTQPEISLNGADKDEDEDDDFGDFADFSEAPAPVESRQPEPVISNDDGFDDFQDFATPLTTTAVEAANAAVDDDDDDDFGDFSEPSYVSAEATVAPVVATAVLPQPPPPAATHLSITERVKPVLNLMFPNQEASRSDQVAVKQTPLAEVQSLHFGAIEQAHALDYQWVSSEMRHSLVRSLGIDSRNILFGDKWNSSMPRFAANLSYDPLKPLKPLSTATTPVSSVLDPTSSWQSTSNNNNNNNNSTLQSLEESHVQTLQLEQQQQPQQLDQVTMVANADKINLVTSNYSHNLINNNNHDALDAMMELYDNLNDNMTINNHNNHNNNNQCNANANANEMHNFVTHFATICNNNNNNTNNNHAITTTTNTTTTNNTNITAHVALLDLRLEASTTTTAAATTAQASEVKTQPGFAPGQGQSTTNGSSSIDETIAIAVAMSASSFDDTAATTSVFAAAATTATISPALPTDGNGHHFDDGEQLPQQQQLDLRSSCPSPPLSATATATISATTTTANSQQLHEVTNSNSYALPLKETHIYTPSKSDTAVAKTTTLAPIDFDYEIASAGIIIDETVVKKEYRDVEYKPPPFGIDSPSKASVVAEKPTTEDDDFSDFQSVSAIRNSAQLQPPRNGTPTFGEQMILSPAILLPQSIPLAKPSIEWGDNALASINAEELARIEELFSHQSKPPTISATVAQQSPKQQQQQQTKQQKQQQQQLQQEDDEWSDFVSVSVQQQQQQQNNHNNNVVNIQKPPQAVKDDDWSDFVSSTPLSATLNTRQAAPQFNSGAWQSANFYNNPMSLYQQQQQPHGHSNLVPKYQSNKTSSSSNNNNNVTAIPQQIHMMHDFSTVPTATPLATPATYQQQHHQHHQQQLQQQQQQLQQQQQHHRQQFHLGNAKVAPRISLIPDLSFVAPALPTNAGAFMSSLPKPSFGAKK
ncbi:hypothetical protein ACLKA7_011051 [Drosophila subpalustris]